MINRNDKKIAKLCIPHEAAKIIASMKESAGTGGDNLCEAWNRGFRSLVGTSHPTIWKVLEHICMDNHNVKIGILLESRGQPPQKRVHKVTKQLQDKLFNLRQAYYNDEKTIIQTLKGIGHNIRWK